MRVFAAALLAALVVCIASPARAGCDLVSTRTVALTAADGRDRLEARASGPDCARAVVTVSLRRADGTPLAAFAAPLGWLREGLKTLHAAATFLDAYVGQAQLDVGGATIPEWAPDEPTPGFSGGMELTTPLDRETYAQLRTGAPNMLCLADVFDTGRCYVWNGPAGRADVILQR